MPTLNIDSHTKLKADQRVRLQEGEDEHIFLGCTWSEPARCKNDESVNLLDTSSTRILMSSLEPVRHAAVARPNRTCILLKVAASPGELLCRASYEAL